MTGAEKSTADQNHFDSAGVGVVANDQWTDADTLVGIGASAKRRSTSSGAFALPGPGGEGPSELLQAAKILLMQCRWSS